MELRLVGLADDAYQMLRGLRTLPTRLARHGENAAWWSPPGCGTSRRWPRCSTPPCRDRRTTRSGSATSAARTASSSLCCRPVADAAVDAFLDALTLFGLGFSWGGFESLAISSATQLAVTAAFPADLAGPLIRLHIGLEDPADLIADLRRGLDALRGA